MKLTETGAGQGESQWEAQMQEQLLEALEDYRRGIADAPCVFKWSVLGAVATAAEADWQRKELGDESSPMTFVASTEEVDRHGDVVSVAGWKLDAYRKNPVFLWAHDYARPAIGRATQVWTASSREAGSGAGGGGPALMSGALLVKVEFAPTSFAQEVASLYRGGYQKGVSVGFRPLRYEERRHPQTGKFLGIRFTEQVLLEVSAAPVPANENAVRRGLWPEESWLASSPMASRASLGSPQNSPTDSIEGRVAQLERCVGELRNSSAPARLPQLLEVLREARAGP